MVNDTPLAARRRQQLDPTALHMGPPDVVPSQARSNRPLSWHPSSYQPQTSAPQCQQFYNQYPFPATFETDMSTSSQAPHYSPVPAAYSCSASPNSAFSPLSLPYNTFESTQYLPVEGWNVSDLSTPSYVSSQNASYAEPFPTLTTSSDYSSAAPAANQWNTYAAQGFSNTSPPTPENLPQIQQSQPAVSSEDAIPYKPLDETEEEGEILVGMGLYDAPDKYDEDPGLTNSRSAMSSLLGGFPQKEATGKGLKLEEAWQPPESDDEGEDDGDDEDGQDTETKSESQPQAV